MISRPGFPRLRPVLPYVTGLLITISSNAVAQHMVRDLSFQPQIEHVISAFPESIVAQPGGHIILRGNYEQVNGEASHDTVVLDDNGQIDESFATLDALGFWPLRDGRLLTASRRTDGLFRVLDPKGAPEFVFDLGSNTRSAVTSVVENDDRSLVFSFIRTTIPLGRAIVRINPQGIIDDTFADIPGQPIGARQIVRLPGDKFLVVADFPGGTNASVQTRVVRLFADGAADPGFIPRPIGSITVDGLPIESPNFVSLADGGLLLGAQVRSPDGSLRYTLARLDAGLQHDNIFPAFLSEHSQRIARQPAVLLQPNGRVIFSGPEWDGPSDLSHARPLLLRRFQSDGREDAGFQPETVPLSVDHASLPVLQPDGKLLVSGFLAASDSRKIPRTLVRLLDDGAIDTGFDVTLHIARPVAQTSAAVQPATGDVVLSGEYNRVDGESIPIDHLIRIRPDGSWDRTYLVPATGDLFAAPDGSIYVVPRHGSPDPPLRRVTPGGEIDAGFAETLAETGLTVNNPRSVRPKVDPIPDGRLLFAGDFTFSNGDRSPLVRLFPDGGRDASFRPELDPLGDPPDVISGIVRKDDGRILAWGMVSGSSEDVLFRLEPDGAFDASFRPLRLPRAGSIANVAIDANAGGEIYVGGFNGLLRLHPDGTLDRELELETASPFAGSVADFVVEPNGKVVVARWTLTAFNFHVVERVHRDGSLDTQFDLLEELGITILETLAQTPSGELLLAGRIAVGGDAAPIPGVARFRDSGIPPRTFRHWKRTQLGDPDAADLGDADADGIVHLIEYALGLDPTIREPAPLGVELRQGRLHLAGENLVLDRPDIRYELQAANALDAPAWDVIATWTGAGGPDLRDNEDLVDLLDAGFRSRYLRLRLELVR